MASWWFKTIISILESFSSELDEIYTTRTERKVQSKGIGKVFWRPFGGII